MAPFTYIARDNTGKRVTGSEDAASSDELVERLQGRNLIVINVSSEGKEESLPKIKTQEAQQKFSHQGVTGDDLVVFCRQLATLLTAGVTILKSLDIISKQVSSRRLNKIIKELMRDMESGLTFHEALSKHPKIFSELWVNLMETGEASGNLANVLSRLASYLERTSAFKKKMVSSLIYPVLLMSVAVFALLFLTIKIIPTFAELFKGFNMTLPLITLILMATSEFIRKYILLIAGVMVAGFFALKAYTNTKKGRTAYEKFQFSLPVFGEFCRALAVERFSSGMSTLIESGVPILYSLEITEHSVNNTIVADVVRHIKEEVREGKPLSQALEKSGFFEPMVSQMVRVGEEVGDLPQMFKRVNSFYQDYTETFLTRFSAMFEPIVLIFMGLVIGIMVIGIFLPIFKIASGGAAGS